MSFQFSNINPNWTLFLDRDGVINVEKNEDYIRNWEEFNFYEESLLALPILAKKFNRIVIVTNQKGIGKGLMTHDHLIIFIQIC
jgi:histidinol phosphatase-like enzyme